MLIAAGVVVGMWLERFDIVVSSLQRTNLPSAWGDYTPRRSGTGRRWPAPIGLFLCGFLLFVRFLPVYFDVRNALRSAAAMASCTPLRIASTPRIVGLSSPMCVRSSAARMRRRARSRACRRPPEARGT
jgi:hypothetical protein